MTMRSLLVCAGLALAVAAAPGPAAATEIQRVVSPGGIEAWLVHDSSVPVISVSISFKGGAALDPTGKEGLADMVSGLLDEGAGELVSETYQEALEDIAATLSFDASRARFDGRLKTLSEHRDRAFRLLGLALTRPRFDAAAVERIRGQLIASLESERDNPRRIAGRTWYGLVFGSHPYAKPVDGTIESIRAITRDDLVRFVHDRLTRANLVIGVAGDITAAELARRLDEVFGPLPAKGPADDVPEATPIGGKLVVIRKQIPQSVVVFGQAGLKRDDPDFYAAYVMNYILGGGGFNSRLTEEIREKRGLAYSVYSYLNPLPHGALIMGGLGTVNAQVGRSIDILKSEWQRIARDGVSAAELAAAKTYLNGSFPLRLDSTRNIAEMLVAIQIHHLGIDYIARRPRLIDAVTREDVRRVAARLLDAQKLTVVVVGNPVGLANTQ